MVIEVALPQEDHVALEATLPVEEMFSTELETGSAPTRKLLHFIAF